MFNLRLSNAATIRYSLLKFWYMHLCGKGYKYLSPHCCKCNSFGGIAAIRCDNACHGPHSDSVYSGSEHCRFNSPRLVKREAGFPNPRRALIGSNQLWRVDDSPYYREFSKPMGILMFCSPNLLSEILVIYLQIVLIQFVFRGISGTGTVAYLGHGEKTNYSANPPGRNTNPPGRNSQSARAE